MTKNNQVFFIRGDNYMKKSMKIAIRIAMLVAIFLLSKSYYVLKPNQSGLVKQFGKVVSCQSEPGIYFKIPMVQNVKYIGTEDKLYDMEESDVITSDKKSMIVDSYCIWRISNPLQYYKTLTSIATAESRINVAVYNSTKNCISSTPQTDVIKGKDGTLSATILDKIDGMDAYGIDIRDVEIKSLDLPEENKASVYERMISERNIISAQYTAEGQQQAKEITNRVESQVRVLLSEAQTEAAMLVAEGEAEYYELLAEAYNSSADAREFYQFIIGLNSLRESLQEGGTIVIDQNSPIYEILNNE